MKMIYKNLSISILICLSIAGCKTEPAVDKSNPFFTAYNTPFNVPPFEKIMAKHYMPAFEKGMAEGRSRLGKNPSEHRGAYF